MGNNKVLLDGCINQFKKQNDFNNDYTDSQIFEIFSIAQIIKNYNLSFDEIDDCIVDGGHDGGIDAFLMLINEDYIQSEDQIEDIRFNSTTILNLYIGQSKTENSFRETVLDKLITTIPLILNLNIGENDLLKRFNVNLVEKILIFRKLWKETTINGGTVKVHYFYSCTADTIDINSAFNSKVEQLKTITTTNIKGVECFYNNYSAEELIEIFKKSKPSRYTIIFKEQPISTKFEKYGIGYVGVVKLSDYYNFIVDEEKNIRENLFESNIRHYQGEVDVNKDIKNTLNNEQSRDFWWLNNGITIIANDPKQVDKELSLENVQIVNGLQTSYVVGTYYNYLENDPRSILVKVIINNDKETIDKIITATNRQNKVSPTLLRATEGIQRNIELYFLDKGYFYDRRKNFYKNQGKPSKKIFNIQYAAQAIETILNNNPSGARAKPTSLIKEDSSYKKIFNTNIDIEAYLQACLITQKTFLMYSNYNNSTLKDNLTNFKLHLTRCSTSVLLNKGNYNSKNIKEIIINEYTPEIFNKSIKLFNKILSDYQKENPDENLINIAKSKKFSEILISKIQKSFPMK